MADPLDRLIAAYRGWNELEARLGSGIAIIDFDLAPTVFKPEHFSNRVAVLEALNGLLRDIPPAHAFLRSRATASVALLRALMGEEIPFPDYIQQTMELPGEPLPEAAVENQRKAVSALLEKEGLHFSAEHGPAVGRRFHDSPDAFIARVPGAVAKATREMSAFLSLDSEPGVEIELVSEPVYWKSWARAEAGKRAAVRFNMTPRRPYIHGEEILLAFHEVGGHALQMECWSRRIAAGELHPAYGVTVVHAPEQFLFEGISQVLTDAFLSNDQQSGGLLWSREYERYLLYVYQHAHVLVNRGVGMPEAVATVQRDLPFESGAAIAAELRGRKDDPVLRTYQFVYAASAHYFLGLLQRLGRVRFLELLGRLYFQPLSTSALMKMAQEYSPHESGAA